MDILGKYDQEHPQAVPQASQWRPPAEYGFFVRTVMRISGGRIRDTRQAGIVLLVCTGIFLLLSVIIVWPRGGQRTPSPEEMREVLRKLGSFPANSSGAGTR
ncbi:MAG: hypothetical protein HY006_02350 [Candidatus Sungbacteria bacterium]|nr:hypothetical protein [Candidatus Sungbacteria bacterium]